MVGEVGEPRLGSDGRPVRPASMIVAIVLGFVGAGLSVSATLAMLLLASALASAMGVPMGEAVWTIGSLQLAVAVLLVLGSLQLRWGKARGLYVIAMGLHVVNCLGWFSLGVAWNFDPAFLLVPILLGAPAVAGLVQAARRSSSEYVRVMRSW